MIFTHRLGAIDCISMSLGFWTSKCANPLFALVTADHFAVHVMQPQSSDRGDWVTEPRHVRQIREFKAASPKVSIMWFIQYHPKSGKSMKIYMFLYIHGIYQIESAFMSCFYMFLSFPPQKYGGLWTWPSWRLISCSAVAARPSWIWRTRVTFWSRSRRHSWAVHHPRGKWRVNGKIIIPLL